MQDILLIAAVAAVFAFGWYLMGKLDAFLESNRQDQIALLSASENILRIGFFDPLVADSLSGVLEKYSKIHPSVSASLFSGTETELMREFSLHKLDMVFLPENASVPEKIRGQVDEVSLEHMPVVMQYGGLQIEPITEGRVQQKVVWEKTETASEAKRFIQYLKDETSILNVRTAK